MISRTSYKEHRYYFQVHMTTKRAKKVGLEVKVQEFLIILMSREKIVLVTSLCVAFPESLRIIFLRGPFSLTRERSCHVIKVILWPSFCQNSNVRDECEFNAEGRACARHGVPDHRET